MELHTEHAEPPRPHAVSDGVVQTPIVQQPLGQLAAVQKPPTQAAPEQLELPPPLGHGGVTPQRQAPSLEQLSAFVALQLPQVVPPTPQNDTDGVLHDAQQHPLGQVVALQGMVTQLAVASQR